MWYKYRMSKKYTIEEIKLYIESFGYTLLSTEYNKALSKLDLQCPEGHLFKMRYNNFKNQSQRCSICFGTPKKTIEEVRNYIESFNYNLLSTVYINNKEKLVLQCPEGHIIKIRLDSFSHGTRCSICSGNDKNSIEKIKKHIESFDYKLLSTEYINNKSKIKLQCSKNHTYQASYHRFQQGDRCPLCANSEGKSKPEKEIVEHIKINYYKDIIENDRTQVKNFWSNRNLELDIFLPDISKAIEFNGIYWHKNNNVKWKDEMKRKQCIQKGIELLVIQEQDWYNDKLCCLNKINELIGA